MKTFSLIDEYVEAIDFDRCVRADLVGARVSPSLVAGARSVSRPGALHDHTGDQGPRNEVGHVMATWPRIQFGAANYINLNQPLRKRGRSTHDNARWAPIQQPNFCR